MVYDAAMDQPLLPMRDYTSSIDREQLRRIKYETTPEQRMNWLEDAAKFVIEARKNWKKRGAKEEMKGGG